MMPGLGRERETIAWMRRVPCRAPRRARYRRPRVGRRRRSVMRPSSRANRRRAARGRTGGIRRPGAFGGAGSMHPRARVLP